MTMLKVACFVIVAISVVMVGCRGDVGDGGFDLLLETGRAHLTAGEYSEAVVALESAVEQKPEHSTAYFLLGQAYNQTGKLSQAVDAFDKVLELDPESAAAYHNLGVTYLQLGDVGLATDAFEAALELDPDDADTRYQLGAAYLTLALADSGPTAAPDPELLAQATEEFEKALALRENMPEALIGLGNIHLQQGDPSSAIPLLQQAIDLVPSSREAHYALGGAYAQSGNIAGACETYSEFLSLGPPPTWHSQAEQIMARLGCE